METVLHLILLLLIKAFVSIIALFIILMLIGRGNGHGSMLGQRKDGKEPSLKRQLLEGFLIFYAFISLSVGIIEVFTTHHAFDNRDRFWFVAAMLSWAFVYNYLNKRVLFKALFGFVQVIGGLWVNWYELRDINESALARGRIDRLLFLCAGVALLAKGLKNIDESLRRNDKEQQKLPATPEETPAAPVNI